MAWGMQHRLFNLLQSPFHTWGAVPPDKQKTTDTKVKLFSSRFHECGRIARISYALQIQWTMTEFLVSRALLPAIANLANSSRYRQALIVPPASGLASTFEQTVAATSQVTPWSNRHPNRTPTVNSWRFMPGGLHPTQSLMSCDYYSRSSCAYG